MWKILLFFLASLSAVQIEIGKTGLDVEIANTTELRHVGLSGRKELLEGKGMLFVFDRPQILSFWMKDTHFPLSIGFFNADQVLLQIENMQPLSSETAKPPIYRSDRPSLYALEVPQGWFQRHDIKPGMKFRLSQIEEIR